MKTQRYVPLLLLVLFALILTQAQGLAQPTAAESSLEVDALIVKAQANGTVPIIVGLKVGFQPEGSLDGLASVQNQRNAISMAQDALLTQLTAFNAQSVKMFAYIPYMAMWVDEAALTFLSTSRDVTSIEEDVAVPPTLAESVPLIGAPTVWASGYTGSGQVVAILDTGVDKTHPFLTGKVVSEACYSSNGGGAVSVCPGGVNSTATGSGVNCSTSISGCTHGTHVAGIVAGKDNGSIGFSGVAKDANIIAIQVFSRFDSASSCGSSPAPCARTFFSDVILGLQQVQTLSSSFTVAAVNMSLGGGRYYTQAACDSANASIKAAIDNLRSLNIATVIASGNNGYTGSMAAPGCISSAVSVGSTGDGSSGTTRDAVMSYSNSASFLNLLAPGSKINSSQPGNAWANWEGTSMATPHVAGAWALLKSRVPEATVTDVLAALTTTGLSVTDSRNGVTKPRIQVDLAGNALEQLSNGVPLNQTMMALVHGGTWRYYYIDIPGSPKNLVIDLYNLSADLDLYVRQGSKPTLSSYDCRPYFSGTTSESCTFNAPASGRWWIGVNNWDTGAISYTVKAKARGSRGFPWLMLLFD
jgi:subtilisin